MGLGENNSTNLEMTLCEGARPTIIGKINVIATLSSAPLP